MKGGSAQDLTVRTGTAKGDATLEREEAEVTHHTWNPWRGCTRISPGWRNCYMFRDQARYGRDPADVVRTKTWGEPLRWQMRKA